MIMHDKVVEAFAEISKTSSNGCAIGLCFMGGSPARSHFTYPNQFLAEYDLQQLARADATLHFGFSQNGIAQWCDLERDASDRQAFTLARQHGISDGVCFSLTTEGRKTIASVSQTKENPLTEFEINRIHDYLVLAATQVCQETHFNGLSTRSIEWLKLAANGHNDTQTAQALGLTIHGARARRLKALDEIGARTPAHAILKAIQTGALNPYEIV